MNDEIKKRIQQRMNDARRFRIERIATGDNERNTSLFSEHVTSQLKHYITDTYGEVNVSKDVMPSGGAFQGFREQWTDLQLENHIVERLSANLRGSLMTFNLTVQPGVKFFSPPYDEEWYVGSGLALGGRYDGEAITVTSPEGFSAAGIGFYLTTNEPVVATITPQGTYEWSWMAFADLPFARSSGGMGLTIYTNGQPQPTLNRQPVLWNVRGMTTWGGDHGSGKIAQAASPSYGGFPFPLAPVFLDMVPGSTYLIWVWCWQTSLVTAVEEAWIAFMGFTMPFVTIEARPPGPPVHIG